MVNGYVEKQSDGSENACFSQAQDLVARSIGGETLIVPVRNRVGDLDAIYSLDTVSSMIWGLIDGQTSLGQVLNAVCDAYDVDPEQAANDIAEFLSSLESAGLIQRPGLHHTTVEL